MAVAESDRCTKFYSMYKHVCYSTTKLKLREYHSAHFNFHICPHIYMAISMQFLSRTTCTCQQISNKKTVIRQHSTDTIQLSFPCEPLTNKTQQYPLPKHLRCKKVTSKKLQIATCNQMQSLARRRSNVWSSQETMLLHLQ